MFILLGQSSTAIKHVTDAKKMEDAPHEKGIIGSNLDFQIHWYNFNNATWKRVDWIWSQMIRMILNCDEHAARVRFTPIISDQNGMTKNSINIVLQPFLDSITMSIVIHSDEEVGLFKSGSHRVPWTHFVIESKMMRDSVKMKRFRTTEMTQFRGNVS